MKLNDPAECKIVSKTNEEVMTVIINGIDQFGEKIRFDIMVPAKGIVSTTELFSEYVGTEIIAD